MPRQNLQKKKYRVLKQLREIRPIRGRAMNGLLVTYMSPPLGQTDLQDLQLLDGKGVDELSLLPQREHLVVLERPHDRLGQQLDGVEDKLAGRHFLVGLDPEETSTH